MPDAQGIQLATSAYQKALQVKGRLGTSTCENSNSKNVRSNRLEGAVPNE